MDSTDHKKIGECVDNAIILVVDNDDSGRPSPFLVGWWDGEV